MKPSLGPVPWLPPRGFNVCGFTFHVVPPEADVESLRDFWRELGLTGVVSPEQYFAVYVAATAPNN
jgi:hypothetical protein